MAKTRKPGLFMKTLSVEIETTTNRHKKPCDKCGALPKLGKFRVKVTRGAGRHAKTEVYCETHGYAFVQNLRNKAELAMAYIGGSELEEGETIRV